MTAFGLVLRVSVSNYELGKETIGIWSRRNNLYIIVAEMRFQVPRIKNRK